MIIEHSAHLISLLIDFHAWFWWYTCLLLLKLMLSHRQTIFESRECKFTSSPQCRIWTRVSWKWISSRLNSHWQTDWAIWDQAKNLNSIAHPYDQQKFSPLDPSAGWLSHLALLIYMLFFVNSDALTQVSEFRIESREVVSLCWMQESNQGLWNRISSRLNAYTQRLSYRWSSYKTWTQWTVNMISEHSAHLIPLPVWL